MGSMCCSDRRVKETRSKSVLEYMEGEGEVSPRVGMKKGTMPEERVGVTNAKLDRKDKYRMSQTCRIPTPELEITFLDIQLPPKDRSLEYLTEGSKEAESFTSPLLLRFSGKQNQSRDEQIADIKKTFLSIDLLNPSQAKNVRNLLQKSRKRNGFQVEKLIGIVRCRLLSQVEKEANIVLTTLRIYWLEVERMKTVYLTAELNDLEAVSLTWDLEVMILHFLLEKALPVAFQSLFVRNLLTILEYMNYEEKGRYLPYRKAAEFASIQSCIDLADADLQEMQSFQATCCLEVLVHYGEIGEAGIRLMESTCITAESSQKCVFWLTDRAIYTLNRGFQYQFQVRLEEIEVIVIMKKEGTIGVQVKDILVNWLLPLDTFQTLETAIEKVTGKLIKSLWTHPVKPP